MSREFSKTLLAALTTMGTLFATGPVLAAAPPVQVSPPTIPSAQGAASAVPLQQGLPGAYLLIHRFGDVSLMAADGSRVWNRPVTSFNREQPQVRPRELLIGYDPADPFARVSSRVYALGQLTQSSADYLAIAHSAVQRIGNQFKLGTLVTVLDVDAGKTAWSRFYPGVVSQLLIDNGVLVVGDETGNPSTAPIIGSGGGVVGEVGTQSVLTGLTFSAVSDGTLVAQQSWSYSTNTDWARWLALEPAGSGKIAISWTGIKPGAGGSDPGQVLLAGTVTGQLSWVVTTASYPRLLRYDAGRNEIVVIGQTDPATELSYTLGALRESDGTATGTTIPRSNAVPYALEVGDIDGQPGAEWVTTDVTTGLPDPVSGVPATRAMVIAAGANGGSTLWQASASENATAAPRGLSLQKNGATTAVLVAAYLPGTEPGPVFRQYSGQSELRALAGATGAQLWDRTGDVLTPLAMSPYTVDGQKGVLTGTGGLVLHVYALADGSVLKSTPLLADITAIESSDVNGDGVMDLLVGGQSQAVFALDGRTLGANPAVLWVTPVEGEVHQIHALTLPNGQRSLVVVASIASVVAGRSANFPVPTSSGIEVLAADTGTRRFRISVLPDYAWTAVIAQLTPDGIPAIIVPTSSLTAYRVTDGVQLWRFAPAPAQPPLSPSVQSPSFYFSNPAVTADGKVAVEYFFLSGLTSTPNNLVGALLDGASGQSQWQAPISSPGFPDLWRGVAVGNFTAAGTPGVAFTYELGQFAANATTFFTEVDVYEQNTGSLSYSNILSDDSSFGTVVLPINGLVNFGFPYNLAAISPGAVVERQAAGGILYEIGEGHSAGVGDFLATSSFDGVGINIYDATPAGSKYTPIARWGGGLAGGLLIRDLDGDGNDEVVTCTFDWNAWNAVQNQSGMFSVQREGGIRGVEILHLNLPPIAALAATPTKGDTPLLVRFSASGSSDPDTGDSIASYIFDFGDGSDRVTQAGDAAAVHTYEIPGTYHATVAVTDSHGGVSVNPAAAVIQVLAAPAPNPFTFIERTGVATNVFVTSEAKTLSGFAGLLPVSVASNGQYRIDSRAWTSAAGQIGAGSTLSVRHVSSSTAGTATETPVTVGAYRTIFRSVTSSLDRTPDPFGFGTKTGVDPGVLVESEVIALGGYNIGIAIAPGSGIAYRINGGAWINTTGTLQPNDTLQVRHTSSTTSLGYTKTYLKVGGVVGYFTTRTQ